MPDQTEKIYCYVDESGQDTGGKFFIVSVVVAKKDQDKLAEKLLLVEEKTGKKATKWSKSKKEIQINYLNEIFKIAMLKNRIFYTLNKNTKAYKELTILSIATTINEVKATEKYKANIFIDGLLQPEVNRIGASLRRIGIKTEKIKGARDESSPFIRLADAIAGLIGRDQKGSGYTRDLISTGVRKKIIKVLK